MADPTGFDYMQRKSGEIVIFHHKRPAATLRGTQAEQFLSRIAFGDPQQVMARATGNYRRGNER